MCQCEPQACSPHLGPQPYLLGLRLGSVCLHSTHFPNWVISQRRPWYLPSKELQNITRCNEAISSRVQWLCRCFMGTNILLNLKFLFLRLVETVLSMNESLQFSVTLASRSWPAEPVRTKGRWGESYVTAAIGVSLAGMTLAGMTLRQQEAHFSTSCQFALAPPSLTITRGEFEEENPALFEFSPTLSIIPCVGRFPVSTDP